MRALIVAMLVAAALSGCATVCKVASLPGCPAGAATPTPTPVS
jgi:uncharacterized protein YceK